MKCSCTSNTTFGIVNSETNKLRRLTFSKDLANFINQKIQIMIFIKLI